MAAGHTILKLAQSLQLFGEMLPYATDLPMEQSAASGNDDGALLPEDLFLSVINANAFEKRTLDIMKSFQRNVQEILVLGRDKRANEMVRRTVQSLNVFLRIVPFIENQCNALTFLFEHLVAGDQIVQYLAEGDSIVLVSFVGLGKRGIWKSQETSNAKPTMRRSVRLDLACPR